MLTVFRNSCDFELYQAETQAFAFDEGQVFNFAELFFRLLTAVFTLLKINLGRSKSGMSARALRAWCSEERRMQSITSLHWAVASIT